MPNELACILLISNILGNMLGNMIGLLSGVRVCHVSGSVVYFFVASTYSSVLHSGDLGRPTLVRRPQIRGRVLPTPEPG